MRSLLTADIINYKLNGAIQAKKCQLLAHKELNRDGSVHYSNEYIAIKRAKLIFVSAFIEILTCYEDCYVSKVKTFDFTALMVGFANYLATDVQGRHHYQSDVELKSHCETLTHVIIEIVF